MIYLSENLKEKTYKEFLDSLIIKKTIKSPLNSFKPEMLADGFAELEKDELRINEIVMDVRSYADFRKFGLNILTPETEIELLKQGIMAHIWGAFIVVKKLIPEHTALILSEPKKRTATILKIKEKNPFNIPELQNEINSLKKVFQDSINALKKIDK